MSYIARDAAVEAIVADACHLFRGNETLSASIRYAITRATAADNERIAELERQLKTARQTIDELNQAWIDDNI